MMIIIPSGLLIYFSSIHGLHLSGFKDSHGSDNAFRIQENLF